MTLSERIKSIQTRVQKAVERSRWPNRNVTILGASKAQSLRDIRSAAELGILDMGENYAQELIRKAALCLDTKIKWHFIGRLQSNKIKFILPYVASIESVDSLELAGRISRTRESLEIARPPIPILLQVNLGNERQKAGLPPSVIESLFDQFQDLSGVRVVGIFSIPPAMKDPEKMRPHFIELKSLFDRLKTRHRNPEYFSNLSMGMSHDFEIAVEEGATCVRIGEALFGPRPKQDKEN